MPRNKKLTILLVLPALLLVFLAGGLVWLLLKEDGQRILLRAGNQYRLEIADDEAERMKGLSGRQSLPPDAGMLFVFENDGKHCFWMKDTLVPLDIIWLDSARQVVHIEPAVQPDSYPDSFCPDTEARYVIELNAGEAARSGIKIGQRLEF